MIDIGNDRVMHECSRCKVKFDLRLRPGAPASEKETHVRCGCGYTSFIMVGVHYEYRAGYMVGAIRSREVLEESDPSKEAMPQIPLVRSSDIMEKRAERANANRQGREGMRTGLNERDTVRSSQRGAPNDIWGQYRAERDNAIRSTLYGGTNVNKV
jgi:hypothetical protein